MTSVKKSRRWMKYGSLMRAKIVRMDDRDWPRYWRQARHKRWQWHAPQEAKEA
jgi:hypothetical protein